MVQKIKLLPDYGCHSLWWNMPEKVGNIDPATLPLSPQTIERLETWADAYDATLNWQDPAATPGFPSDEAREAFEKEGISLWEQLRKELGPDYQVLYFSKQRHQLFAHPRELNNSSAIAS